MTIHRHFHGRMRIGYGWGTLLTNDFRGLAPGWRARSDLHRLQGDFRRRPPDREALRQSDEGHGPEGRDRALQARLPRGCADGSARAGLNPAAAAAGGRTEFSRKPRRMEPPFICRREARPGFRSRHEGRSNCDMGEGYGPWPMGDDAAMLDIVTSANVACGFHAGDPYIMFATARTAKRQGRRDRRASGLQRPSGFRPPGHPRRQRGGDRAHDRLPDRGPAGLCRALAGHRVTFVKVHGSLNNMANEDGTLRSPSPAPSRASIGALVNVCLPGLAHGAGLARSVGIPVAREFFADRTYDDNGTLTSRKKAGLGPARCRGGGRPRAAHAAGSRAHDGVGTSASRSRSTRSACTGTSRARSHGTDDPGAAGSGGRAPLSLSRRSEPCASRIISPHAIRRLRGLSADLSS